MTNQQLTFSGYKWECCLEKSKTKSLRISWRARQKSRLSAWAVKKENKTKNLK